MASGHHENLYSLLLYIHILAGGKAPFFLARCGTIRGYNCYLCYITHYLFRLTMKLRLTLLLSRLKPIKPMDFFSIDFSRALFSFLWSYTDTTLVDTKTGPDWILGEPGFPGGSVWPDTD